MALLTDILPDTSLSPSDMKQPLLLLLLLLFTALPLSAQRLVGRVIDAKSG